MNKGIIGEEEKMCRKTKEAVEVTEAMKGKKKKERLSN